MEQPNDSADKERGFPNAEEVIEALGGIRPSAAKLGVPVTTVQGWKTRGRIPENRHAEIERTLTELGIQISEDVLVVGSGDVSGSSERPKKADETEVAKDSADITPKTDASDDQSDTVTVPQGTSSALARGAIFLSVLALLAVGVSIFRPGLLPAPQAVNLENVYRRVDKFEKRVLQKLDAYSREIADNSANREKLEQRVEDTALRIETVAENFPITDKGANTASIAQLRENIAKIRAELLAVNTQIGEASSTDTLKAAVIAELNSRFDVVDSRIVSLESGQKGVEAKIAGAMSQGGGRASTDVALLVAMGQLEVAVQSGLNIQNALERVRRIASQDSKITEILNDVEVSATQGLITSDELNLEFRHLRSILAAGRPPAEGWGLADGAWAQLKAAIGLRRIGDESSSPITLAERALENGDLSTAIKVTKGYGAKVDSWREKLGARLRLENNLMRLHEVVVGRSSPTVEKTTPVLKNRVAQ